MTKLKELVVSKIETASSFEPTAQELLAVSKTETTKSFKRICRWRANNEANKNKKQQPTKRKMMTSANEVRENEVRKPRM